MTTSFREENKDLEGRKVQELHVDFGRKRIHTMIKKKKLKTISANQVSTYFSIHKPFPYPIVLILNNNNRKDLLEISTFFLRFCFRQETEADI